MVGWEIGVLLNFGEIKTRKILDSSCLALHITHTNKIPMYVCERLHKIKLRSQAAITDAALIFLLPRARTILRRLYWAIPEKSKPGG